MTLNKYCLIFCFGMLLFLTSCQQPGKNSAGSEYMPDMAHSVAYEANHYNYYYYNTWGTEEEYYEMAKPRMPVKGTVPRGYAGAQSMNASLGLESKAGMAITPNGSVPYHYGDTEEERTRAGNELIKNPFPITDLGLSQGKELYNTFCGICHGAKGDGAGYLVRDANPAKGDLGGVYPVQPAILINDEFTAASNGRYYHAIMYGKNLMGAYADKLSYEERYQVIHYIRQLQAKNKGLEYNQSTNTLNNIDVPGGDLKSMASANYLGDKDRFDYDRSMMHAHGHHGDSHDSHGHDDHGHDDHHMDGSHESDHGQGAEGHHSAEETHTEGHEHGEEGHNHEGHDHQGHDHDDHSHGEELNNNEHNH